MNTFMRIPAVVGIIFMAGGWVACGNIAANPPQPNLALESRPISPTEPGVTPGWADILGSTSAPDGWQVAPCGNPILLCVTANGELVGTVERFSYPLSDIDLAAAVEPAPGAELDYLRAWVAEHYAAIKRDRQIADPALTFTAEPPTEIAVGGQPVEQIREVSQFQFSPDGRFLMANGQRVQIWSPTAVWWRLLNSQNPVCAIPNCRGAQPCALRMVRCRHQGLSVRILDNPSLHTNPHAGSAISIRRF